MGGITTAKTTLSRLQAILGRHDRSPASRSDVSGPSDDPFAITPAQVRCLAEQIRRPTDYTERCVEQLAFLPTGGQRWTRRLQIRVPSSSTPPGHAWRIISLGAFRARRYPDFTARDAAGARLPLLTRDQHGLALTETLLTTHVWRFSAR